MQPTKNDSCKEYILHHWYVTVDKVQVKVIRQENVAASILKFC